VRKGSSADRGVETHVAVSQERDGTIRSLPTVRSVNLVAEGGVKAVLEASYEL